MNRIHFIFLLLLPGLSLFSQPYFTLVNPIHNYSTIRDIEFVNDSDGVFVDTDSVYVTHDGGETWNASVASSGEYFIEGMDGFIVIVGNNGSLLKSFDNGNSWSTESVPGSGFNDLNVMPNHTVYLLSTSVIYKSINEGLSWTEINLVDGQAARSMKVIQPGTILIGTHAGEIYKTTDNGETWNLVFEATGMYDRILTFDFPNPEIGFASVGDGVIIKSDDGGSTWTEVEDFGSKINDIEFINVNVGYACGQNSSVLKTIDGGENWSSYDLNFADYTHFKAIHVFGEESAVAVGSNRIFQTYNGGVDWYPYNCSYSEILAFDVLNNNDLFLIDEVGAVKLDISGNSCSVLAGLDANYNSPRDLEMLNESLGYAIVEDGVLKRTEDGGQTWDEVSFGAVGICGAYYDVSHSGNVVLVSRGCAPFILKSTDYGYTWETAFGGYRGKLQFLTDSIVFSYPVGHGFGGHKIRKSIDRGDTFNVISSFDDNVKSAYFASDSVGYASIDHDLLKTTDGGNSWNEIPVPDGISGLSYVWGIIFLNDDVGWVSDFGIEVYETMDGGISWIERNTDNIFTREFQKYDQTLYASGAYGRIFKKDFSEVDSGVAETPNVPEILIFPNPTSATAIIKVSPSLTVNNIKVYTAMGAQVRTRLGRSGPDNQFVLLLGNYSSGVYIVQIETSSGVFSKKLILR